MCADSLVASNVSLEKGAAEVFRVFSRVPFHRGREAVADVSNDKCIVCHPISECTDVLFFHKCLSFGEPWLPAVRMH